MFPLQSFLHDLCSRNLQRNFAIDWFFSSFSLWFHGGAHVHALMRWWRGERYFIATSFSLVAYLHEEFVIIISIWVNRLELLLYIWYWTWVLFSLISNYWLSSCYAYMSICDWKFFMCIGLCFVISQQVPMLNSECKF